MTVTYYAEILLQYELSWYFVLYHNILIYIHKGLGKQYMATIVDREEKEQEGCSHVTLCLPFSKLRAFNSCCQTKYRSHVCLFSFCLWLRLFQPFHYIISIIPKPLKWWIQLSAAILSRRRRSEHDDNGNDSRPIISGGGGKGSEKFKEKVHEVVIYELMIINITFFFYLYPKVMIKGIIIQYI